MVNMTSFAVLHYLEDISEEEETLPRYGGIWCDKKLSGGTESGEEVCPRLCRKPGKARIYWQSPGESMRDEVYYCREHLDFEILKVFRSGVVNLQLANKSIVQKDLEQLLTERDNDDSTCSDTCSECD